MTIEPTTLTDVQTKLKGQALQLLYVPLPLAKLWDRNPKRHELDDIKDSIYQHGFKDPPKWEPQLNGGQGGIVEGNGRCTALDESSQETDEPPRGIMVNDEAVTAGGQMWPEGTWFVPILFGVDAASQKDAEAYGLDHNNLVMAGGGFSQVDIAQLYDIDKYQALLDNLRDEAEVISVDFDSVQEELQAAGGYLMQEPQDILDEKGDPKETEYWPVIKMRVHPETFVMFEELMARMHGKEGHKLDRLLRCVDTAALHLAEPGDYLLETGGDEEE